MGRPMSLVFVAALMVSACARSGNPQTTESSSTVPSTTSVTDTTTTAPVGSYSGRLRLVVIGDSIPYSDFCPGCKGFVDQYAVTLEETTGRQVEVVNRSRNDSANMTDIEEQLIGDALLREQLGTADIVIVSVGFNDQAPWPTDGPCHSEQADTLQTQVAAILLYTDACIDETIETYRSRYQSIFSKVSSLVPGPSVLLALTVYNNAVGYPGIEEVASAEELEQLAALTKRIFDEWNAMLCDTGTANNFGCVDLYHAFNGPDGTTAPGVVLGADYTHPSQIGNDVIAGLLDGVDVSAITG